MDISMSCIAFCKVKAITMKDVHPFPRMDNLVDKLRGPRFFITLHLVFSHWQVPNKEEGKENTALAAGSGL